MQTIDSGDASNKAQFMFKSPSVQYINEAENVNQTKEESFFDDKRKTVEGKKK